MTQRNLSPAAKAAVYAQNTSEAFIMLLTVDHPDFTDPIRITADPFEILPDLGVLGVVSRGNEFVYLPFMITLPTQDDTNISRAKISIDNVSREIVAAVRQATSAVNITVEIVLASDVDTVEVTAADFKLERVQYDVLSVTGDISVEYFDLEPMPAGRFTPSQFPGLF